MGKPVKNTKLVNKIYNQERPLLTIRSNLPDEIMKFIKKLKSLNKGSEWINEAIVEKWERENLRRKIRK